MGTRPPRSGISGEGNRVGGLGRRGQALVEAVLVTPLLLLLVLGLIEAGNSLSVKHKMAVLSREGANIASRGSSLQETLNVVMSAGDEIALSSKGGAVVTRVVVEDGDPIIKEQVTYAGYEASSRLGLPDSVAVVLEGLNLSDGQVLHAVELIFDYQALTPIAAFLPDGWAEEVYERAIF